MEILLRNKFSSLGMFLGASTLVLAIVHFSFGPFAPAPPTLETVVAEQAYAIKQGLVAGITGQQPAAKAPKKAPDIDHVILNVGIILALIALGLGFMGGMRKENQWGIAGALIFAGGTLVFHMALFAFALICAILLLFLIVAWLSSQ